MPRKPDDPRALEIPPVSGLTLRLFRRVVRSYFRRHFRAVMAAHEDRLALFDSATTGPLIVYGNHPSWWDPMVSVLLAQALLPSRRHYAPMDAAALRRYPILRRVGVFPIEMNSARSVAQFLRTSQAVLSAGGVLWVTPQGRFSDTRKLPLVFRPGLGALAARVPGVTLLPLAIEYTFWDERLPETLLYFGKPVRLEPGLDTGAATQQLEAALEAAMQPLQSASMARDASAFHVLLSGGRGTGGFYAAFRQIRAWAAGKPVALDHTPRSGCTSKKT